MNKTKVAITVASVALSGGLVFVNPVFAQSPTYPPKPSFFQNMTDFFAQKFGLEKTQVESAMTEFRNKHRNDMVETYLSSLVTNGNITVAQKSAIQQKMQEMHESFDPEEMHALTWEERREKMEARHKELVTWAQSQGIDSSFVLGFGFGKGHGMRHMGW